MTGSKKRKRLADDESVKARNSTSNGFGVAQTLGQLQNTNDHTVDQKRLQVPQDSRDYNMASGKIAKRKRIGDEKVKYPALTYVEGRLQSPIRISDLQGLLLYCLADGIAPQWISVKHSGHVRKVVVLMVPGLELGMFDGTIPLHLYSRQEQDIEAGGSNISSEVAANVGGGKEEDPNAADFARWKQGLPLEEQTRRFSPRVLTHEGLPEPLQPLADIFPHVWPVKAPGDAKYNKVHSPLQAILLSSLTKTKGSDNHKGAKSLKSKNFEPERTRITAFLCSKDDLRDNDYILHPAFFATEEEKLANAEERRRSGHSSEQGWVDTYVSSLETGKIPEQEIEQGSLTAGHDVLSLDCEMCITEGGKSELTRISLVRWDGEIVLDELVKPQRPVIDYLTQYSGITEEMLNPIITTLPDIQQKLLSILTPRTVLVGHSLDSDLNALKLTHPFIVDTALIYQHPRGPPLKCSLKWLAQKYLSKEIQKGSTGHDSVEDARAVLELVKQKCEMGELWASTDASRESIFRRLGRSTQHMTPGKARTSAVVDWGSPERGLGSQATVVTGCVDDGDVVRGVSSAVNGDTSNLSIPDGGVDFTWARMRDLEVHRGWCNRLPNANYANESTPVYPHHLEKTSEISHINAVQSHMSLVEAVSRTVSNISAIYDALPPCTLFIVYSGTGDPREVSRLQSLHKQYRAEFQSRKPWDELSVKWTDIEEQALKKACERAREGCGFMCVK